MLEIQDKTKSETKVKGKHGGPRPNSGRPKRMDEAAIIEKLHPMANAAFTKLKEKILEGDITAIKLFCSYYMGMPTQKVENKIEGQLNSVSVEVVRPELAKEEVLSN